MLEQLKNMIEKMTYVRILLLERNLKYYSNGWQKSFSINSILDGEGGEAPLIVFSM